MRAVVTLLLWCVAAAAAAHAGAALFCSLEATQSYLAEGTDYVFTEKHVDYVIVIDKSGSMDGAKLDTVKRAATDLVAKLAPTDRAAIVSFNFETTVDRELTSDRDALAASIAQLKAGFSTQYAPALRASERLFTNATNEKALIFLSDGRSDFGETPREIEALAERLARQGVCILTISYALAGEESEQLKAMAAVGNSYGCGENYIASERGSELEDVFTRIRDSISSTDILRIEPLREDDQYAFRVVSKLNNRTVPGQIGTVCADMPDFRVEFYDGDALVGMQTALQGPTSLPQGTYSYRARAALDCHGSCSFSGVRTGTVTVGGACNPSYAQLATYVAGDTQSIRITPSGFVPRTIAGKQGTPIIWNNTDTVPRRISSAFFNATIPPGGQFTYIIDNIGTLVFMDPDTNQSLAVSVLTAAGSDVLLVVDESGSMKGEPMAEARLAAENFFQTFSPVDRGALVTFSQTAHLVQDFTNDEDTLISAARTLRSEGATNYLTALRLAATLRPEQRQILVFMSDGLPTDSEGIPEIIAQTDKLRAAGWCIMAVGFGKEGLAAKSVLAQMAGEDTCSGFLYASEGELARAFGTIYQLAQQSDDLRFDNLDIPRVRFQPSLKIATRIVTRTGKAVPGGDERFCAPPAQVQFRTAADSGILEYREGVYEGFIPLRSGFTRVELIASVASLDEPARPLVGRTSTTVTYIPWWLLVTASGLLAVAILGLWRPWSRGVV